jgi:hypothetical protein
VLGVNPTSTFERIRSAFRQAAKENHPDRFTSYVQKAWANERMRQMNAAYAVLRDAERRAAYDTRRNARLAPRADCDPRHSSARSEPSTPRPAPPQRRRSLADIGWYAAWMIASALFSYFWLGNLGEGERTLGGLAFGFVVGLFVAPMLAMAVVTVLLVPTLAVGMAFSAAFSDRRRAKTSRGWLGLATDLVTRLAALIGAVFVGVKAFQAEFDSDLLFIGVLMAIGWASGELVGMLVYAVRRVMVNRITTELLRVEPVDLGKT